MHEFFSLTCPHCARFARDTLPEVQKQLIDTGKLRYVYEDFPLDQVALMAAMVARALPPERYEPFVLALLASQDRWAFARGVNNTEEIFKMAALAGMSRATFDATINDTSCATRSSRRRTRPRRSIRSNSTPTFIFNGPAQKERHDSGELTYDAFAKAVAEVCAAQRLNEPRSACLPVSFTRLRIAGFKSFAEPAVVEIRPGLTGIVGPNGCGKSNVVEALRWAMGEGSARGLRGAEMDDVIFAGTAARPSRNLAEVTLLLEEAAGAAPPPFHEAPELEVTRRIERGVGSHFRVNGREARARDVQTPVRRSRQRRARLGDDRPGPRRRAGHRAARGAAADPGGSGRHHRPARPPP